MFITPTARRTTTRRTIALTGAAGAATLLAACGPHVRPSAASSSRSSAFTSDAKPGAPFLDSVRAPQVITTPVPTPQPVTIRPPDPAASGRLWFDSTPGPPPKDGAAYELGFWRRSSQRGYWQFAPVAPDQMSSRTIGPKDLPTAPARPNDPRELQVIRVDRRGAGIAGYWVWNAARYVGPIRSARWEWVEHARPHLLVK